MTWRSNSAATAPGRSGQQAVLPTLLLLIVGLRVHLMLRLNINWDEFHYLSFVYDFLRESPLAWRQTFHVYLFPWLATIPGGEVSQVVAARVFLLCLGLASSGLLYVIGRRFLSSRGALFAVLSYNALAEVIVHGASFRPDPLATFLVLAATAAILARSTPLTGAAAAGALTAFSFMLTLKTVFFLPGLALLALSGSAETASRHRQLSRALTLVGSLLVTGIVLWAFHRQMIVPPASDAAQVAAVRRIGSGILWTGHWFPGRFYILRSLEQNALIWLMLAAGLIHAMLALRSPDGRRRALLPLILALPLATLVFYRNSFPYFFALILAPATLLCGLGLDRLRRVESRAGRLGHVLTLAVVLGVFATGVTSYLRQLPHGLEGQRQTIETVHRMFPEPVSYIDRCSMVASFPKVGFFMSTWGMEKYARDGRPVLAEAVQTHAPPLLLANTLPLNLLLPDSEAGRLRYRLFTADRQLLQQSYIHHWGIIFVAGRHVELAGSETELTIQIPGEYTVEGEVEVLIDGQRLRAGDLVELASGTHRVSSEAAGVLTLRWGDHLYRPEAPPARQPIFISL